MRFISTRGKAFADSSLTAITLGIAPDGGLFVPELIPEISLREISGMLDKPYIERAYIVLSKFLDDYLPQELMESIKNAYAQSFGVQAAPLIRLSDNLSVLELWHGPTLAFKDIALQLLPHLMVNAVRKTGMDKHILILTATSGDTGKAALEAFAGVKGTSVCVYYPDGKVSKMQMLQMHDGISANTNVIAVEGNFDDTQTGVKKMFSDMDALQCIDAMGYKLSSANSINIGRLLPQIVYYFSAYCDLALSGDIKIGDPVDYVVPTGNFGNILAGWYAKKMGLPVGRLICASNSNKILFDFMSSGVYDANRGFVKTISPSMDILISSNLERLLFEASGRDSNKVHEIMSNLNKDSMYNIAGAMLQNIKDDFTAGWADDDGTRLQIKKIWNDYHYLVDPHTAVAFSVLEKIKGPVNKTIVISTANPYKFADDVLYALGEQPPEDPFESIDLLENKTGVKAPDNLSSLRFKNIGSADLCDKYNMQKALMNWLEKRVE